MTNIIEEVQLDYCDVMIKPKRSTLNSRNEPDIYRDYKFKWTNDVIRGNGLTVANMATTGTFAMAEVMAKNLMFVCLHKHYSFEDLKTFLEEHKDRIVFEHTNVDDESKYHDFLDYVFVSTGIKDGDYEKICKVLDLGYCKNLCIDIANGYIPKLLDFVKKIRNQYPYLRIMVGNVVTGDMVQDLILNGADIVKCGIGGGSVCLTRLKTSCGRPQFSTVLECAEAAHAVDGMICADGGIACPGDICKAYGAGADFVMVGGLVAGSDEAAGDIITKEYKTNEIIHYTWIDNKGYIHNTLDEPVDDTFYSYNDTDLRIETKRFKQFYGMSSKLAQEKHWCGMAKYRTSEGREKLIPYTGPVQNIIDDYLGGLRSYFTYCNIKKLKDAPKCTTFYRVNKQLNTIFANNQNI